VLLVVVAPYFDSFEAAYRVNSNADGDGSTTSVTVFDVLLTNRRNVDTAGIALPAIGTLDRLLDKHKRSVAADIQYDRVDLSHYSGTRM